MKYKVGDRVRIKSLDWYNENKSKRGFICFDYANFIPEMFRYCGEILTISQVVEESKHYLVSECAFAWTDEMIEGLVEEKTYDFLKTDKPNLPSLNDFMDMLNNELKAPKGYIFKDENGNVINTKKIVLEKKEKEYPKTYEECCKVIEVPFIKNYVAGYKNGLLDSFQKLLICRDAYWKIAGEEMGLGKPWKPDWEDENQEKYIIGSWLGTIQGLEENFVSHPLAFPTAEMRDAFKENFDPDIEICKELL